MSVRFFDRSFREIEIANRTPISGYLDFPLLPLEQTLTDIRSLVPSLTKTLSQARELCNKTSPLLTPDESAAIYLYTMQTIFFEQLNKALREENRQALKPWFSFIRLFMSALAKLPSITGTVWRGVNADVGSSYTESTELIWWSFNSCSLFPNVVEAYVGSKCTLFIIGCKNGKDISRFSAMRDEAEVVLMPGTRLRVTSTPFTKDNLRIFHIIEKERQGQDQTDEIIKTNYQHDKLQFKIEQYRNNTTAFFFNTDLSENNSTSLVADELKQNRVWKVLCLSFNKMVGISYLAEALVNQSTLKELDLNGVSIDAEGAIALGRALGGTRCLTILRLSYNSIGDRGASALAEMLRGNSTLQKLFLTRNEIEDEGCISLCDALRRNTTLICLYLDDNYITTNSLDSISHMLQRNLTLEFFFLGANPIAFDIIGRIKIIQATRVNETCRIHFS